MIEFTIHNWLLIAKEIVAMQQADTECERLNCFLVIDDQFNFAKGYLKAKENAPYFFSRDKDAIKYPALAIEFINDNLDGYKNKTYHEYCHRINIGVVDTKIIDCKNCTPCESRNKEQIYFDTSNLLRKFLNTMSLVSLFEVKKGSDISYVYSVEALIQLKVNESIYDEYKVLPKESNVLKERFKEKNSNPSFIRVESMSMGIQTQYTEIKICELCSENSTEFKYKVYKNQDFC